MPHVIRRDTANTKGGRIMIKAQPPQGGTHFKPDPDRFARMAEAIRLHREGATSTDIARELGIARRTAQKYVQDAIQQWGSAQEDADWWRGELNKRLDGLEEKALHRYENPGPASGSSGRVVIDPKTNEPVPNVAAQLRALELLGRYAAIRARLNGANRPEQSHVSLSVETAQDREIAALVGGLIASGNGADAARLMLEAVTGARAPVVAGEIEQGPETGGDG